MPKKCNQLNGSVTVDGKVYKTTNAFEDATYSYYEEGDHDRSQMHFTVADTGGGKNDFSRFHITFVFGGTNAKFNYTDGQPGIPPIDAHLPSTYKTAWDEIVTNKAHYDALALAFWNALK